MLHRWMPLLLKSWWWTVNTLVLALSSGWIITARQTKHTDEYTAVMKDRQWRLLVLLLLWAMNNKIKRKREQIVSYFEYRHTLWPRGSASTGVYRHFTTVWRNYIFIYVNMLIKITGHFNWTWADQSIKLLFLELFMSVSCSGLWHFCFICHILWLFIALDASLL